MPPVPRPETLSPAMAPQRVVDAVHFTDQFGLWVVARIGGVETLLIGKQQQFVSPSQNGPPAPKQVIVVAHLISAVATASFS